MSETETRIQHHIRFRPGLGGAAHMPIECADGTLVSVQASATHQCTPKNNFGPWSRVEVWICETNGVAVSFDWSFEPIGNFFCNVPIAQVAEYIDAHGGIRSDLKPENSSDPQP